MAKDNDNENDNENGGNDTKNGNGNGNNTNGMEMGMGTLMGVLMAEGLVKAPYTSGSKDPSLKMVKVDGSMLSQVGLAPVMNQGKEHQSVSLQQKEQA